MTKRIELVKIISWLMWGIAIFAYFFQFPFKNISGLIIPCLAGYLICKINKLKFNEKTIILLAFFLVYLFLSAIFSVQNDTGITRIIRFLFILLAIVFCAFIRESDFKRETDIFILFAVLKSVVIIAIAVTLIIVGDYSFLRNWAWDNGLGDIYFLSRVAPKVQVQGNALLLISFIAEYMRNKVITKKLLILLLGILFAGNFAYILGLGLFVIYIAVQKMLPILRKTDNFVRIAIAIVILMYIMVIPYLLGKIEEKSDVSNQTRIEQAGVLLDTNIFVGDGLGNYIQASTPTRNYDGDIYFELQTLYMLNQIGIAGLLMFYAILYINIREAGKEKLILYGIYLVYTFWNPYCFDTTQIIATLLIINMIDKGVKNEKSNCYSILSR